MPMCPSKCRLYSPSFIIFIPPRINSLETLPYTSRLDSSAHSKTPVPHPCHEASLWESSISEKPGDPVSKKTREEASPSCGAGKMKGEGCPSCSWESCAIYSGYQKFTSGPCEAGSVKLRHLTKPNSFTISLLQKWRNSRYFITTKWGEKYTQRCWVSCPKLHSKPDMMAYIWNPRIRNKRQEDSHEFKANIGYNRRPHLKKQNETMPRPKEPNS